MLHRAVVRAALALGTLLALCPPAVAGWTTDPVPVFATTNSCPQVAACSDAAHGAVVVWQENTATGNVVRAAHLLATGDVDPAWPAPASVCTTSVARSALGAIGDGLGGAYVWWMSGTELFLTRLAPDGALAAGWPVAGRRLGTLPTAAHRPSVAADGANGVYVAWPQVSIGSPMTMLLLDLAHLGPANTPAGGFTGSGVHVVGYDGSQVTWVSAYAIAAAPGGGVWLAWGSTVSEDTVLTDGDYRFTRLNSAGRPAPGWTVMGARLDAFPATRLATTHGWSANPAMSLVGIAPDTSGGAYVAFGLADPDVPSPQFYAMPRLVHYGGDALPAPDWPAGGLTAYTPGLEAPFDGGANASYHLFSDLRGGVIAGVPGFGSEGFVGGFFLDRYSPTGVVLPYPVEADQSGLETAQGTDGSVFVADCNPVGPYSDWDPLASVRISSAAGATWSEWHTTPVTTWYGDAGVAATDDGGAILAWSQVNQRYGIFAVRVNGAGLVTGIPPAASGPMRFALHDTHGAGLRAVASLGSGGAARWGVFDVAGRRVAGGAFVAGAGVRDWTLSGTAAIPAGVYFGRVECGAHVLTARVALTR